MKTDKDRFHFRASKSGCGNATSLWGESLSQCENGWPTHAIPLISNGKPFALRNPELNVAFLFGVAQSDKLRACDDLRHARTNLACAVETPIKLVSWGRLAELTNFANDKKRGWAFS